MDFTGKRIKKQKRGLAPFLILGVISAKRGNLFKLNQEGGSSPFSFFD